MPSSPAGASGVAWVICNRGQLTFIYVYMTSTSHMLNQVRFAPQQPIHDERAYLAQCHVHDVVSSMDPVHRISCTVWQLVVSVPPGERSRAYFGGTLNEASIRRELTHAGTCFPMYIHTQIPEPPSRFVRPQLTLLQTRDCGLMLARVRQCVECTTCTLQFISSLPGVQLVHAPVDLCIV